MRALMVEALVVAALLAVAASTPVHGQPVDGQERAPAPDTVITLRSEGTELLFIPDRLTVRAGMRVRIRYRNDGELPHNFVLARSEDDLDPMADAAYTAAETGFVPADMTDRMIAYTSLVSPGQTVEIDFVAPPPGEYTYICLFPGHANMMLGTLRTTG